MPTNVIGELQIDARFQGGVVEKNGDLTVDVKRFHYDISGTKSEHPGLVNVEVVDNSTNFILLTSSFNLEINQSGWPIGDHIRLARVITSGGVILSIIDERAFLSSIGPSTVVPHAANHIPGGPDEISTVVPSPNSIPQSNSLGLLDSGWMSPPSYAQRIVVAKTGGDFNNITDAVSSITDASITKPYIISVFPGIYQEPPLTLKPYISIVGQGSILDTIFQATDMGSHFITGAQASSLINLGLEGPSNAGFATVYHSELSNTPFFLQHVVIRSGYYGIWVDGSGTSDPRAMVHMLSVGNQFIGSGIENFVRVTNNSYLSMVTSGAMSGGALGPNIVFYSDGQRSKTRLDSCFSDIGGSSSIYINNGASLRMTGGTLGDADIGVHIGPDGASDVDLVGVSLRASLKEAVRKESASAYLRITGSADKDKFPNIIGPDKMIASFISSDPSESSHTILGEFAVGNELIPKESCFGGGDSHTRGMTVLTNTNLEVGVWNDITSPLLEEDGLSVAIFAGTGVGQSVYIGSDYPYPGLKYKCVTPMDMGGGSFAAEYWNGTSWVPFYILATDANYPYHSYAQTPMMRANSEQIRFGDMTGWTQKTLNGVSKYWARYRIQTSINSSPIIDQFKLHTDRTEINSDGLIEYFGKAEQWKTLVSHKRLNERDDNFQPGKIIIPYGTDAGAGLVVTKPRDNNFKDGQISGIGGEIFFPHGLNTAKPIRIGIGWYPDTSIAGDVEFTITYGGIHQSTPVDGTNVSLLSSTISPVLASEVNLYRKTFYDLIIPDVLPGDFLYYGIKRDATIGNLNDTYAGSAIVIAVDIEGYFWR